jgi:hypothetical protein
MTRSIVGGGGGGGRAGGASGGGGDGGGGNGGRLRPEWNSACVMKGGRLVVMKGEARGGVYNARAPRLP